MSIFDLPDQSVIDGLQPYQGWWAGLVWGEGTEYHIEANIDGLLDFESRLSDVPIPQAHGEIPLGRWATGRIVTLPFRIFGGRDNHADRRDDWFNAFSADNPTLEEWLIFRALERTYMARARVVRRKIELSPEGARVFASHAVVELKMTDPRLYDGVQWVQGDVVPTGAAEGGGFDLEVELALDMSAATGGTFVATNTGNTVAYPLIRVNNPIGAGSSVTSVTITNETHSESAQVDTTIAVGQTLEIDFDALIRAQPGPHIHIDGVSRFGDWQHPRMPWGIHPGDNDITASFTGGAPTVRMDWLQPQM